MVEGSNRNDVLFVLKVPPPFGGGEIEHQYIYDELRDRYSFLIFSRKSHNKAGQGKVKLNNLLFGLGMMFRIFFYCLKNRPKVVFLWLPKDLPAFLRTVAIVSLLRIFKTKVIGDLHGMGFSFLSGKKSSAFFERQINKFYAIRTLSLSISNDLRSSGFNNIIVPIDNGVKAPAGIAGFNPEMSRPLKLLYLGAISDSKGFLRVLHVVQALYKKNVACLLTVAGEWTNADFKRQALDFIEQNDLSPFVRFAGILNGEEKWSALKESHFLLHLSEWDGQPLTIIEAMAAGVPTLSHKTGGIPEMIVDGENGFFAENSRQAAEILIDVLEGRIHYQRLCRAAKATFEKRFTIDTYIENIEKLVLVDQHASGDTISKNR